MDSSASQPRVAFSERVYPSALSLLPTVLLTPGVALVAMPFMDFATAVILGLVSSAATVAVALAGAPLIRISTDSEGTHMTLGRASIKAEYLGKVSLISPAGFRSELGPGLNALAHLRLQTGVKSLVKIQIEDDSDPTPYWLFSSRQGEKIKKLLEA
jgi:hypothetical protein